MPVTADAFPLVVLFGANRAANKSCNCSSADVVALDESLELEVELDEDDELLVEFVDEVELDELSSESPSEEEDCGGGGGGGGP